MFPASWLKSRDLQEALAQEERLRNGKDPDEDTIYNQLCPKIREKWSKSEEQSRRVSGRRQAALVRTFRHFDYNTNSVRFESANDPPPN